MHPCIVNAPIIILCVNVNPHYMGVCLLFPEVVKLHKKYTSGEYDILQNDTMYHVYSSYLREIHSSLSVPV